jgi:hypothetical protein
MGILIKDKCTLDSGIEVKEYYCSLGKSVIRVYKLPSEDKIQVSCCAYCWISHKARSEQRKEIRTIVLEFDVLSELVHNTNIYSIVYDHLKIKFGDFTDV